MWKGFWRKRDGWKKRVNETVGNLRMERQKKIEKRIFKQVMMIKKENKANMEKICEHEREITEGVRQRMK